ncbi:unnamed protein product, partial [Amoebophrya sp. A25]
TNFEFDTLFDYRDEDERTPRFSDEYGTGFDLDPDKARAQPPASTKKTFLNFFSRTKKPSSVKIGRGGISRSASRRSGGPAP